MARRAHLISLKLYGRDDLLSLGGRRLAAARNRTGGLLFLAGEAGIGKSRLLRAIEERAAVAGVPVIRGATYPRDLEVAAAVFLDSPARWRESPSWRRWASDSPHGSRAPTTGGATRTSDAGSSHSTSSMESSRAATARTSVIRPMSPS